MCFFDQHVYRCGDFKWGPFRQHCAKEYRAGETCGIKLVMQNIHVRAKCKICIKLELKYDRKAKEEDRIRRWKSINGEHRRAFIEASEDIIERLNDDIAKLMLKRGDSQNKLDGYATEVCYKEKPVQSSYQVSSSTRIPELPDLRTRHRLKDSDNEAISEEKFLVRNALLPQKEKSLPNSHTESQLVKGECRKKTVSSEHTGLSADENGPHESQNDDRELQEDNVQPESQTETEINCQESTLLDTNKSRNNISSYDKPSKALIGSSETANNRMNVKVLLHATIAGTWIRKNGKDFHERQDLAHPDHKGQALYMSNTRTIQENTHQPPQNVYASEKNAFLTLQRCTLQSGIPSTFQDKSPENSRLFHLFCTNESMVQVMGTDRGPRNDSVTAESETTSKELLGPSRCRQNQAHYDVKSMHHNMICVIILLVRQGLFDYLMSEFYVFFNQTWSVNLKSCPGSPDSSSGSDTTSVNPMADSNTSEESRGDKKRRIGDPDKDKHNEDGKDNPKRPRIDFELGSGKFACPYFKRDPGKFGVGTPYYLHGCAGQGWPNLGRLKEHLYRAHHSFFQCTRCKTRFRSQTGLNEHSEAAESCESRTRSLEDGFDPEIYLYLHSKKKTRKGQTTVEGWKEIFSRLFPNQTVPSPYVGFETGNTQAFATSELDELENFEAYRQREVPKQFVSHATIETLNLSEPIARHLLGKVPNMVKDAEETVSQQYQSTIIARNQGLPDPLLRDTLSPHPDIALSTQPGFSRSSSRFTDRKFDSALQESCQTLQMAGSRHPTTLNDLHSRPPVHEYNLGRTTSCFCSGPCTCPGRFPGQSSAKTGSIEDSSQILQIVQNMSNRITMLEQKYEGRAFPLNEFISSSLISQLPLLQTSLSSRIRDENMREVAARANSECHVQNTPIRPSNLTSANVENSIESWDWESMINIDNSAEYSYQ